MRDLTKWVHSTIQVSDYFSVSSLRFVQPTVFKWSCLWFWCWKMYSHSKNEVCRSIHSDVIALTGYTVTLFAHVIFIRWPWYTNLA